MSNNFEVYLLSYSFKEEVDEYQEDRVVQITNIGEFLPCNAYQQEPSVLSGDTSTCNSGEESAPDSEEASASIGVKYCGTITGSGQWLPVELPSVTPRATSPA